MLRINLAVHQPCVQKSVENWEVLRTRPYEVFLPWRSSDYGFDSH